MARKKPADAGRDRYYDLFPTRLREIMSENRITQEGLAEKLGVTYRSVGTYCRGDVMPSGEMIVKIADALSVSTDYLLGVSDIRTISSGKNAAMEYLAISENTAESLHALAINENTSKLLSIFLSSNFAPVLEAMEQLTDMFVRAKTFIEEKDRSNITEKDVSDSRAYIFALEDADRQLKETISAAIESRMRVKPQEYIEKLMEIISANRLSKEESKRKEAELEAIWNSHSKQRTEDGNE